MSDNSPTSAARTRPVDVVGQPVLDRLAEAGFAVVPLHATRKMRDAAAQVMRRRMEAVIERGEVYFRVSSKAKAGIRWEAMLDAWQKEINQETNQETMKAAVLCEVTDESGRVGPLIISWA